VKIYPEKPSSWTILAVSQPILVLISACSVQKKNRKIEKFHTNAFFLIFSSQLVALKYFFREKIVKIQQKKLHTIFRICFNIFDPKCRD